MPVGSLAVNVNGERLSFACGDYDRTRPLLDGTVGIEGYRLEIQSLPPEEMFRRAFESAEFDVSELSASTFLLHVGRGTCPYIGLPVFPSRAFRHAAIYVRAGGQVSKPQDLRGKVVGVRNYLNTAALVVRGFLADDYDVASHEVRWRVGDVDDVERKNIPIPRLEKPADIQTLGYGKTLTGALLSGEIDALVHYNPPRGFTPTEDSPLSRLFSDPAAADRVYFEKTGIFPIMHLVGIRRPLLEKDPSLARKVYNGFVEAKGLTAGKRVSQNLPEPAMPWIDDRITSAGAEADFWPYGICRNEAALASLVRYAFEQGLTHRPLDIGELFHPDLLES
jgi:4,5-dihydroxyphthalate decarboxylase